MPVLFKYNGYTFDPAPLVSYNRERVRDSDNLKLYDRITLSCNGALINDAVNTEDMDQGKFAPLVKALSEDHRQLIIQHDYNIYAIASGLETELSGGISGVYPLIDNLTTEETTWNTILRYSFDAVWNEYPSGVGHVETYSNSWNWQEQDDNTTVVTHTITAKGLNTASGIFDRDELGHLVRHTNSLDNAREFIKRRRGLGNIPVGMPSFIYEAYSNKSYITSLKSEAVDVSAGQISLTENFILSSGVGIPLTYIDRRKHELSYGEGRICQVSIQGRIVGDGDEADERWENAKNGWDLIRGSAFGNNQIFLDASGIYGDFGNTRLLNNTPISETISENRHGGTIDYSLVYSDEIDDPEASGILSSSYQISINNPIPTVVEIPIPGKQDGPVWQDLNTQTDGTYELSGDVVGIVLPAALSFAQTLINKHGGQNHGTQSRISSHSFNKDEKNNSVSFSITWTFKGNSATSLLV